MRTVVNREEKMFLGYMKNKEGNLFIAAVSKNIAELRDNPCFHFEKIEKSEDNYVLCEGNFINEREFNLNKEIRKKRLFCYQQTTDQILLEKLEQVSCWDDMMTALTEWRSEKEKVRSKLPYVG